ncbi:MAG: hypothetical protein V1926_01635 [Candidatus Peregrinibacteria bacterium]
MPTTSELDQQPVAQLSIGDETPECPIPATEETPIFTLYKEDVERILRLRGNEEETRAFHQASVLADLLAREPVSYLLDLSDPASTTDPNKLTEAQRNHLLTLLDPLLEV